VQDDVERTSVNGPAAVDPRGPSKISRGRCRKKRAHPSTGRLNALAPAGSHTRPVAVDEGVVESRAGVHDLRRRSGTSRTTAVTTNSVVTRVGPMITARVTSCSSNREREYRGQGPAATKSLDEPRADREDSTVVPEVLSRSLDLSVHATLHGCSTRRRAGTAPSDR